MYIQFPLIICSLHVLYVHLSSLSFINCLLYMYLFFPFSVMLLFLSFISSYHIIPSFYVLSSPFHLSFPPSLPLSPSFPPSPSLPPSLPPSLLPPSLSPYLPTSLPPSLFLPHHSSYIHVEWSSYDRLLRGDKRFEGKVKRYKHKQAQLGIFANVSYLNKVLYNFEIAGSYCKCTSFYKHKLMVGRT